MQGNRRRDTNPETHLRRRLHAKGLRYRVDHPLRPDGSRLLRPDIVFTRARVAVFVDGCFWHGCPEHFVAPKSNRGYWGPKIAGNRERDSATDQRLAADGWIVLRCWEHESMDAVAEHVERVIREGLAKDEAR
jgi:DNA mismatch endonuclease (patch repair protein)